MAPSRPLALSVALLCSCICLMVGASAAGAATFTVTTTADSFDGACTPAKCSLRDAVQAANGDAAADTILLPAGTLQLELSGSDEKNETGDLDVTQEVIIRGAGAGATSIHSTVQDRVLDASADLSLINLTVSGGQAVGVNANGGGIRAKNGGTLELDGVVVRENLTQGEASSALGGGIAEEDGRLVARNSAILFNTARTIGFGGGIALAQPEATLSLTNVTVAGNRASSSGGGIFFNHETSAELAFTTVIENEATISEGGVSGNAQRRIRSSIISGNKAPDGPDCEKDGGGVSLGGNVGSASCGFAAPLDFPTTSPLLAPLAGANVPVAEPLPGSPAIDHGLAPCPATDARGVPRPQGGACDSGAAERPVPVASGSGGGKIKITRVSVSRTKFRAGPKVISKTGKGKTPIGTTISFSLSAAAKVKPTVLRVARGRKVGGKCLAPTKARRGKPGCTRLVGAGSLSSASFAAGRHKLDFSGRVGGHNLAPGRYLVQLAVPASKTAAKTPILRIVAR